MASHEPVRSASWEPLVDVEPLSERRPPMSALAARTKPGSAAEALRRGV